MMTEEQVKNYLKRIGLEGAVCPDQEGLEKLVWAHLTHVPFENLTVCEERKVPSLEEEDLFHKVVEGQRGGYCFELNRLFYLLLEKLGFEAWPVAVRIRWGRDFIPAISHRATAVRIGDAQYLADVGYGGPGPKGVIRLSEEVQEIRGVRFRVTTPRPGFCQVERETKEGFAPMLLFENRPALEIDFNAINFYYGRCEDTPFYKKPVIFLCTEEGGIELNGSHFTVMENGHAEEKDLGSREEILDCIRNVFHIGSQF